MSYPLFLLDLLFYNGSLGYCFPFCSFTILFKFHFPLNPALAETPLQKMDKLFLLSLIPKYIVIFTTIHF